MKEEVKESNKQFVKIAYKDRKDIVQEVISPIEDYDDRVAYRENVERVANEMWEEGGFWLNATTIIPFHRVVDINVYSKVQIKKPYRGPRRQRIRPNKKFPNNENIVPSKNEIS